MSQNNAGNLILVLILLFVVFFIFQLLGILFLILKGVFYILFKFWYVFLFIGLVWYIVKKIQKLKNNSYNNKRVIDNDKTIEIDDYEVK